MAAALDFLIFLFNSRNDSAILTECSPQSSPLSEILLLKVREISLAEKSTNWTVAATTPRTLRGSILL